jgi:CBS domain-containing protein
MVPLAGVAFVAETTGAPGYVIPGLLAAALAYLVSGRMSLSQRQRAVRRIDFDTRLDAPVEQVMTREWTEVPPDATLHDFANRYVIASKARTLPVADDGRYLGMISLTDLGRVPDEAWSSTPVREVMVAAYPYVHPGVPLRDAVALMRGRGVDRIPVLREGRIAGMLSTSDVVRLEQLIDTVREEQRRGLGA